VWQQHQQSLAGLANSGHHFGYGPWDHLNVWTWTSIYWGVCPRTIGEERKNGVGIGERLGKGTKIGAVGRASVIGREKKGAI